MQLASVATAAVDRPPCALAQTLRGLVVGTYDLDKRTGVRTGSLDLYSTGETLAVEQSVPVSSAILDVRTHGGKLYTAHSTGEVRIWDDHDGLAETGRIQLAEEDSLVTQIALHGTTQLAEVETTGDVVLYDLAAQSETYRAKVHDLEGWTVVFDEAGQLLYSGGDDRGLACIDPRIPFTLWKVKPHEAGVTSILPRAGGTTLWTGGYDDCINQFDVRTRRVQDSKNLGGGVWRLIPNPANTSVLACCMYGGLRVLNADSYGVVEASLTENHESMVYGGAWLNDSVGFTCSFYDKVLQKWNLCT